MGTHVRVHFFDEQGQMARVSTSRFNELNSTGCSEHFKTYAGQRVRCALSFIHKTGKEVTHIAHTSYSIFYFDQNGNLDEAQSERQMALAMSGFNLLERVERHSKRRKKDNVLNLMPKISEQTFKNDFQWEPTEKEAQAIIDDIFG